MRLRLLTRPDCHLCEDFAAALHAHLRGRAEVEARDVDEDPELARRHGLSIPVLLAPDGGVVCRTRFDAAAIDAVLGR